MVVLTSGSYAAGFSQATSPPAPFQYQMARDFDQCAVQPSGRLASASSRPCSPGTPALVESSPAVDAAAVGLLQATSPPAPFQYPRERDLDQCAVQPCGRPSSASPRPRSSAAWDARAGAASATAVIARLKAHRLQREARIVAAMTTLPQGTLDDWLALAYADVPERMWPVAKRSLIAHVERLESTLS